MASNKGCTPLAKASMGGHIEVVQMLLGRGANIELKDSRGQTPLHVATIDGHLNVVRVLVEHGASINSITTANTPVGSAALYGHLGVVKFLLDSGASIIIENTLNPLYLAASRAHWEVMELLLSRGASLRSTLNAAAESGNVEVAKFLLDKGAVVDEIDKDGATPLLKSAFRGHSEVLQLLVERGAKLNVERSGLPSPLYAAALSGRVELVKLLLDCGEDVDTTLNLKSSFTPLHGAAIKGHLEVVKLLLERGASVEASSYNHETPLDLAAEKGHLEVVDEERLLDSGGGDLYEPLLRGSCEGHLKVVQLLLDRGANVNATNNAGNTAVSLACSNGHLTVAKLLVERGANIHTVNFSKTSPIYAASVSGHVEVVQFLLELGANVHGAEDEFGDYTTYTPLHAASSNGHLETVKLLVENGATCEGDEDGFNPLDYAVQNGNFDVVKFRVESYGVGGNSQAFGLALIKCIEEGLLYFAEAMIHKYPTSAAKHPRVLFGITSHTGHQLDGLLRILIENGSQLDYTDSSNSEDVDGIEIKQSTALHVAVLNKEVTKVWLLAVNGAWTFLMLMTMIPRLFGNYVKTMQPLTQHSSTFGLHKHTNSTLPG